jgi:apolipoprotein N-acyltransferase
MAGLVSWALGAAAQLSALASVFQGLRSVGGSGWAFALVICLVLAIFEGGRTALLAFGVSRAMRNGWAPTLAFAPILVATELVYPLVFPWYTALFVHSVPLLMQGADIAGPLTLSAWMALVNASLATAWLRRRESRARLIHGLVVPALVFGAVVSYGAFRMREIADRVAHAPRATIGLVQGNVSAISEERDPAAVYRSASLDVLRASKPDFLVWPEAAIFYPLEDSALPNFFLRNIFRDPHGRPTEPKIDVPVLAGVVVDEAQGDRSGKAKSRGIERDPARPHVTARRRFNSAVLAEPGGALTRYDKRFLVTLGESIPFEGMFPFLHRLVPLSGGFSPGAAAAPLSLGDRKLLTAICYEDILYRSLNTAVAEEQPDLLVNLTNDGWFGRSEIPSFHFALSVFRAVEHRRFLVRATNDGLTAVVDPVGRITMSLPAHQFAAGVAEARWMKATTLFEVIGDRPWYAVAAIALVFMLRTRQAMKGRWVTLYGQLIAPR